MSRVDADTIERPTTGEERGRELLEDHALESVPADRRKSLAKLIIVQIGWNISVSAFLVGGVIGAGSTFERGVAAILLGNLFLAAIGALVGVIGYRTGFTSYLISRTVFGMKGSLVVSLLLGVLAMGFIGVLMDTWASAIDALLGVPWTVVVLLFAAAITATAIFGFKGLAAFSTLAVPVELAIALFALVRIGGQEGGFGAVFDYVPATPVPFTVAVGAAITTWITGAALVSDISRYALRARDAVIASLVGFAVGAGVFETVAMISAMKVGDANLVNVMNGLGLLAPAVVMLVLALWNTADNNLYSSALAFTNASKVLGRDIPKPVWTVVSVTIAVIVAFIGFAERFLSWLGIIANVVPPFAGIILAHFWILGGLGRSRAQLSADTPQVRWTALVTWAVTAVLLWWSTWFIDAIVGLVVSAGLYTALQLITTRVRGRAGSSPRARAVTS